MEFDGEDSSAGNYWLFIILWAILGTLLFSNGQFPESDSQTETQPSVTNVTDDFQDDSRDKFQ
ncbi:MAG: hypothetical protein WBF90_21720 [Rivularia sp. (in: cyanobacteria)]|jgi:hypothetical protein